MPGRLDQFTTERRTLSDNKYFTTCLKPESTKGRLGPRTIQRDRTLFSSSYPVPSTPSPSTTPSPRQIKKIEPSRLPTTYPPKIDELVRNIFRGDVAAIFEERIPLCHQILERVPEFMSGSVSICDQHGRISQVFQDCTNGIMGTWLRECPCQSFDRINYPKVREFFENQVIKKAMKIIEDQLEEYSRFDLNLVIHSPGKLAGEAVLITQLLKEIIDQGYRGRISLMLIDPSYEPSSETYPNFKRAQDDFLDLLSCLKRESKGSVSFKPYFLSTDVQYRELCRRDQWLKSDLLIASDLGSYSVESIVNLYKETKMGNASRIALMYEEKGRKLYRYGRSDEHKYQLPEDWFKSKLTQKSVTRIHQPQPHEQTQSENDWSKYLLGGLAITGIAVVAGAIGYSLLGSNSSQSGNGKKSSSGADR